MRFLLIRREKTRSLSLDKFVRPTWLSVYLLSLIDFSIPRMIEEKKTPMDPARVDCPCRVGLGPLGNRSARRRGRFERLAVRISACHVMRTSAHGADAGG